MRGRSSNLRSAASAGACTTLTADLKLLFSAQRRCLHLNLCLSAPINLLLSGSLSAQRNELIGAMVYKHSRTPSTAEKRNIGLKYMH